MLQGISLCIMHVPHIDHVETLKWQNVAERRHRAAITFAGQQTITSLRRCRASHILSLLSCHLSSFVEQLAS